MTIGKGLTGGTMTMGATMTTARIYDAFLGEDITTGLMHGPTYMANPLACSAALASLELFERGTYLNDVITIEAQLYNELTPLRELAGVVDVRIRGAIGVVQLANEHVDVASLRAAFAAHNVWVRPFADVVYLMPPLVIQPDELSQLTRAVCAVVEEWSHHVRAKVSHLFD
jgi:adenosylmethionine-8-amino-7-oxononanoate aminotransferase